MYNTYCGCMNWNSKSHRMSAVQIYIILMQFATHSTLPERGLWSMGEPLNTVAEVNIATLPR